MIFRAVASDSIEHPVREGVQGCPGPDLAAAALNHR